MTTLGIRKEGNGMNYIHIGLIGCGVISAWRHIPAMVTGVSDVEVVALRNRDGNGPHVLGDQYCLLNANQYTDYRPLFSRKALDAALIAVSPEGNCHVGMAAVSSRPLVLTSWSSGTDAPCCVCLCMPAKDYPASDTRVLSGCVY